MHAVAEVMYRHRDLDKASKLQGRSLDVQRKHLDLHAQQLESHGRQADLHARQASEKLVQLAQAIGTLTRRVSGQAVWYVAAGCLVSRDSAAACSGSKASARS